MTLQNIMNAFPSKYMKASDFDAPRILTIADVKIEEIANGEHKPVLFSTELSKGIVLNKTNAKAIARLYGTDPNKWNGKQVVAYKADVEFRGDMVESIRLKAPKKSMKEELDDEIPHFNSENPAD